MTLRRKAWEVLSFLAERPGAVVSNDELLDAVWPGIAVTPQTLTNVVHELRVALDDGSGGSRWLQTVSRRGHVFLPCGDGSFDDPDRELVVGRVAEIALLHGLWLRAREGSRQTAMLLGEPGIGKTTVVEEFRRQVDTFSSGAWEARGVALEQQGRHEAYLPLLSALEQLATGARRRDVSAALRAHAPTWLFRMPSLLRTDERAQLQSKLAATSAGRMLREGIGLVRALARTRPLLLVLEDFHWADDESLDLLAALARDADPVPLMVVVTFRPADPAMQEHRVVATARALLRERRAVEVPIAPFDEPDIATYLEARLGFGTRELRLSERLLHQSSGNPLFLRALVDELLEREAIIRTERGWEVTAHGSVRLDQLPTTLRTAIQWGLEALSLELRAVLEGASVVGVEFTAPEAAAASAVEPDVAEDACERLAGRGRLLRRAGEVRWIDGNTVERYAFPHASHRAIVYESLPPIRQHSMHLRLARALESGIAQLPDHVTGGLAAIIAEHYDRGGLPDKAIPHLENAAAYADATHRYRDAVMHVQHAIETLDDDARVTVPRTAKLGELYLKHGAYLVLANGYSTPEVERSYVRARNAFTAVGMEAGRFMAEVGLCAYLLTRAQYAVATEASERLLASSPADMPAFGAIARCWAGFLASAKGDLRSARVHLTAGLELPAPPNLPRNFDAHRMLQSQLAIVVAVSGDLEHARALRDAALRRSAETGLLPDLAHARLLAAELAVFTSDREDGLRHARDAVVIALENDLRSYLALARAYEAYLCISPPADARIATIRGALADRHAMGDLWHESMLRALVAELELAAGRADAAGTELELAAAHARRTGERHYEPEIIRLRGECMLASAATSDDSRKILRCLERAIDIADRQGAALWRRRAENTIARVAQRPRRAMSPKR